jgi:hypothetical protein
MIFVGMLGLRLTLPVSYSDHAGRWLEGWGKVLLAGIVLGLTTSIRLIGPFAGVLVAAYWIGRHGRRAVPDLLVYAAVAGVTTYLTWPVLWGNPLVALTHRASEISEFSQLEVFFWGTRYETNNLPWQFLPTLFAIQWTLPSILLFLGGTPFSWSLTVRTGIDGLYLDLTWLLLPVGAVMLGLVPIYHNFRHVLFALPPAFVIMGFGAWKVSAVVRAPWVRAGLVVLALAPGILGIARLHPYEYIYYNELVGGVRGAEGKFELDYWCTAFREAMAKVNQIAGPGDQVVFARGLTAAAPFARDDLQLWQGAGAPAHPDFALACRRNVSQASFFPEMKTVYEVRADGALLAVVKER